MTGVSRRGCSHYFACWLVTFAAVIPCCVMAQQQISSGNSNQLLDSGKNEIDTRQTPASTETPGNNPVSPISQSKSNSDQARIEQNQKVLDHLYNKIKNYDSGIFNYEKKIN